MPNQNLITTAAAIAAQLGETVCGRCATIWRIVRTLGPERAQAFAASDGVTARTLSRPAAATTIADHVLAAAACQPRLRWTAPLMLAQT